MIYRYLGLLVSLVLGCTRVPAAHMAPLGDASPPDLVASIAQCHSRDPVPPITSDSGDSRRPHTLSVRLASTLDPAWRGQSSVWLVGPLEHHASSAQIVAPLARGTLTGVHPGRYAVRFRAIGHFSRVDTLIVEPTGMAITVPMVAAPAHSCGFDGYQIRVQPPTLRQPNER